MQRQARHNLIRRHTPSTSGIPTVPTMPGVSSQQASSVASALWQPFVMTNDAPAAPWPDGPNVPKVAAKKRSNRPESETVPSLLRPFYVTNEPPRTSNARHAKFQRSENRRSQ